MTTNTAWLSVSATGTKTFYLGADSQGTSLKTGKAVSLHEKKVFDSACSPEIFSLSGDLTWGSTFLRRLLVEIKHGSVSSPLGTQMRAEEFCRLSCANPPLVASCELDVLYGVRSGANGPAGFKLFWLHHPGTSGSSWKVAQVGMRSLSSEQSALVYSSGLGGRANKKRQEWIAEGDQGNVARTCFWSLCDLVNGRPSNSFMTGGHPQLVKLDQMGCGKVVGVKFNGVPTVYGRRTTAPQSFAHYWVDENFTQLDPKTSEKFTRGQRYGRRVQGR
jgi:hypothetical protein